MRHRVVDVGCYPDTVCKLFCCVRGSSERTLAIGDQGNCLPFPTEDEVDEVERKRSVVRSGWCRCEPDLL